MKRLPAHLAIGHDFQADTLLERDGFVYDPVFDLFELEGARLPAASCF